MKAVVRTRYGTPDVLELKEVDRPVPVEDQVLVRVYGTSLNKADLYELHPPFFIRMLLGGGRLKPKEEKIGTDIAGRVEAVGPAVKSFKPGDEVFGGGRWSFAEYACARERSLALISGRAKFDEAATLPIAATTALQALRKAKAGPGQRILIDGSSGGVGTFTLQIAKSLGAEVTAVCSTGNVASARSMGADNVIDYTKEDFTKSGQKYDLILGVNGHHSILGYRRALSEKGVYMMVGSSHPIGGLVQVALFGKLVSKLGRKRIGFMGIAKITTSDLEALMALVANGKVKPLIDRRYPLSETADAFRYFQKGHTHGKVVVELGDESPAESESARRA